MSRTVIALVALLTFLPASMRAQDMESTPNTMAIVEQISEALDEVYVFPEVARQMNELMRQHLDRGAYRDLDLPTLAAKLTEDLQSISRDRHLSVRPVPPQDTGTEPQDLEAQQQRFLDNARRQNYGFTRVEILQGNVGYLDLRGFFDAGYGGAAAVAAMNFLASADALIIDLRNNGGGSPSMIQLITSYFFEQRQHLNSFYVRRNDSTRQFFTQEHVQGPKMIDTPIWVLTSGRTFSAAEEFTYNLKHMERAQVVGEVTGGGAHPVEDFTMAEHGLRMSLPFGRAINPITGTNWEGTGVMPDTNVPADNALAVAHRQALEKLAEAAESPDRKFQLEWAVDGLAAEETPFELSPLKVGDYPGTYGPRRVWLEDGVLTYQRGQGREYQLAAMDDDLFRLINMDTFRIRFERDDKGKVTTLVGLYDNGTEEPSERTSD
ncbi:MAG: S41 family peptidase [Xanthomonadales bacterium]|nr:S41 family peptidase [Xanthomonadales bacterium]